MPDNRHPTYAIPVPPSVSSAARMRVMPAPSRTRLAAIMGELAGAGVHQIVSLLPDDEALALGLEDEAAACGAAGLAFSRMPISDFGVPSDRALFRDDIRRLATALADGRHIAIHCRAGIGRSGLVSACVLVSLGLTATDAIDRVSRARGHTAPETSEQRAWVHAFV